MKRKSLNRCPICNNDVFNDVATCTDYFTTSEQFIIESCTKCGFKITKDYPSANEIGRYYQSKTYISHSEDTTGIINKTYHAVKKYMLLKKANLVIKNTDTENRKVLDYGAGTGMFVEAMKQKGWDAIGIEKDDKARQTAIHNHNIELKNIEDWKAMKQEHFDAITLWHVMEHVENLEELWSIINANLKTRGTLVVALPNCDSYDAKHYKNEWAAYDVPRHLWHFNSTSFQNLAKKHGFEIIKTKKMPFDGFYISMLSEQNCKKKLAVIRGFIHGLCGYITSIFNKNRSSSLIYILKKSGK